MQLGTDFTCLTRPPSFDAAPGACFPAGQVVHAAAPAPEKYPAGHSPEHAAALSKAAAPKRPAGQSVQVIWLADAETGSVREENLPAGHDEHFVSLRVGCAGVGVWCVAEGRWGKGDIRGVYARNEQQTGRQPETGRKRGEH